jgi:hypothetical protein
MDWPAFPPLFLAVAFFSRTVAKPSKWTKTGKPLAA